MTQDNRIRLDPTLVDFTPSGTTGQAHDNYPAGNTQARYDWMRSFLIGLLSNQSGESEPIQKRLGTLWLKVTAASLDSENNTIPETRFLKVYNPDNTEFINLAEYLGVDVNGSDVSLQSLMASVLADVAMISPTTVWSGTIAVDNASQLPIPSSYQGYAALANMRAFVWIDGILLDPRITEIPEDTKTYIKIKDGYKTKRNQRFTVEMKRVISLNQETIIATS